MLFFSVDKPKSQSKEMLLLLVVHRLKVQHFQSHSWIMSITKDNKMHTWIVQFYYTDWTGEKSIKRKEDLLQKKKGRNGKEIF